LETLKLTTDHKAEKHPTPKGQNAHSFSCQRGEGLSCNSSSNSSNAALNAQCYFCKTKGHYIQKCTRFLDLAIEDRIERVKQLRLCINCLRADHSYKRCYAGNCRKCNGRHSTFLHFDKKSDNLSQSCNSNVETKAVLNSLFNKAPPQDCDQSLESVNSPNSNDIAGIDCIQYNVNCANSKPPNGVNDYIILSTAIVTVFDTNLQPHNCRVLLDSASQSNFITQELCESLGLVISKVNISVVGINQVYSRIQGMCTVTIQSKTSAFKRTISCLILSHPC